MNDRLNVFVTENNVELFLSKAYKSANPEERDGLLRLIAEEQRRMGHGREHVENAQRRLLDCRARIHRQRHVLFALPDQDLNRAREQFLLETLEMTLSLMEEHQRLLGDRQRETKP